MPAAMLFESRGGRMGFRVVDGISKSVTLSPPALTSDTATIRKELRARMVHAGLLLGEAQAMVDTAAYAKYLAQLRACE